MKWTTPQLQNILTEATSGTWGKPPVGNSSDYPVLRSTNIHDDQLVLEEVAMRSVSNRVVQKYALKSGDILVTTSSGSRHLIGKNALFDAPEDVHTYLFSNFTYRLRPQTNVVIPRYLHLYLNSAQAKAELLRIQSTTSGLRNLNVKLHLAQSIPLPPPSEQRRIVEILEQADAFRKKRAEADAKAERILPALFYQMFGDPATNPMGWDVFELGNLSTKVTSGSRWWAKYTGRGNSLFVRTQDINDGEISTNLLPVDPPPGTETERTRLCDGDVVITITGVVGKAAVFKEQGQNVYVSQHVALVHPKCCLQPEYLTAFANFPSGSVPILARFQYGQTKPGLGFRELKAAKISLPPIDLQKQFASHAQNINALKQHLRKARAQLEKLWNVLLYHAFSGDLTAKWREAHTKELLDEMEVQVKALGLNEKATSNLSKK